MSSSEGLFLIKLADCPCSVPFCYTLDLQYCIICTIKGFLSGPVKNSISPLEMVYKTLSLSH